MASRKYLSSKGNREGLAKQQKPSGIPGGAVRKQRKTRRLPAGTKTDGRVSAAKARIGSPRGVYVAFPRPVGHYGPMQELNDPRVEAAVSDYFRTLSERDKNAWIALFDKSAAVHEPVGATPAEGREGLEQVWQVFTGPFATLTMKSDEVFYSGSGAAARWSGEATSILGSRTRFSGITVFEVDDEGRIQTVMSYWDPAAVLIRLAGDDDA